MAYKEKAAETSAPNNENERQTDNGSGAGFGLTSPLFDTTIAPKYGDLLGSSLKLLDQDRFDTGWQVDPSVGEWRQPGYATVGFMPTFGVSDSAMSPVNLAATDLYKKIQNAIRKVNLGYQSSDIMMQLAAHDSIFMMYNYIKRGFQALAYYNPHNAYVPTVFFAAMGLNYESFVANAPKIHQDLVVWEKTLRNFPIPAKFNAFAMHSALLSNIFADAPNTVKHQSYVFVPSWVFRYPTMSGTTHSDYRLEAVRVFDGTSGGLLTYEACRDIFTTLLTAVLNSSDFQQINSNLLSTFEGEQVYTVTAPNVGDALTVAYSEEVLNAITNARIIPVESAGSAKSFGPEANASNIIVTRPWINNFSYNLANVLGTATIINASKESLDSRDAAMCLRWNPVVSGIGVDEVHPETYSASISAMGTEVVTYVSIWGPSPNTYGGVASNRIYANYTADDTAQDGTYLASSMYSAFHFFPTVWSVVHADDAESDVGSIYRMWPEAQWRYTAVIDAEDKKPVFHAYLWQALME